MKTKKTSRKKILRGILIFLAISFLIAGIMIYRKLYSPFFDVKETVYVYVDDRKDYNDLLLQLETTGHIKDIETFKQLAQIIHYPKKMRTGRFAITSDISAKAFIQNLANGMQAPVKLTFNNIRLKEEFTSRMGQELMFRGDSLLARLNDADVCAKYGFDTVSIISMFIPNTYEIYWNVTIDNFLQRMKKEYDKFWNPARIQQAEAIPMTPLQVAILASIVEEETAAQSEYATVAGLYINRLKTGMLLQADPTLKYAANDFSIRRVTDEHKKIDSPYNTYMYTGLPPGPIRLPSIRSMEAVLNYDKHNYIFMCAKEDFSGKHNFATNYEAHKKNAEKYQKELDRRGIH